MDENVLSGGTLNKAVSLGAIKPLNCTLLSHKLTPFASMSEILPCRKSGREKRLLLCRQLPLNKKRVLRAVIRVQHVPAALLFREVVLRSNQKINPSNPPGHSLSGG